MARGIGMDVFLLGAGRPARGVRPSALKEITKNTKVMDWLIHNFSDQDISKLYFIGGYQLTDIIENYPNLEYVLAPNWENGSILSSLSHAPFRHNACFISYTDILFKPCLISEFLENTADITVGIDLNWKNRFENRSSEDIEIAETINLCQFDNFDPQKCDDQKVELTGLCYMKANVSQYLQENIKQIKGSGLTDLLSALSGQGFSIEYINMEDNWSELNQPEDIAHFILKTKAKTLQSLKPILKKCYIEDQYSFTAREWVLNQDSILQNLQRYLPSNNYVIRSSANAEDSWTASNAGGFTSILNVPSSDRSQIIDAVDQVIQSYGSTPSNDQILVQPHLKNVKISGVIFTCCLETGAPYYCLNFDDKTRSTESVTSGTSNDLRSIYAYKEDLSKIQFLPSDLQAVIHAAHEIEQLLGYEKLDIEFAVTDSGNVCIFQVRPIVVDHGQFEITPDLLNQKLQDNITLYNRLSLSSPFLYGDKIVLGNMPDWNPAEIIGTNPKTLSLSLYKHLITNDIWAQQRAEFGYRDVSPSPLLIDLNGQPYIDVRASLNSFIPNDLPSETQKRLAQAYIDILVENPQKHDKIEFDVAFTIWTPTYKQEALKRLRPFGVTEKDITLLEAALKELTRSGIRQFNDQISSVETMENRNDIILNGKIPPIEKAYLLIEDCRKYGTLAFSHAARAGFVASTFLKSLVKLQALTEDRLHLFMRSVQTVASTFEDDKQRYSLGTLSQKDLIQKYGHLRPGTYEITAEAYWEDPEHYFKHVPSQHEDENLERFKLTEEEINLISPVLTGLGYQGTVQSFFDYMKAATEAREEVKFKFSKNLSQALDQIILFCQENGISRNEASFLDWHDIQDIRTSTISVEKLKGKLFQREAEYHQNRTIMLPQLISSVEDFYCFERFPCEINYITHNKTSAPLVVYNPDIEQEYNGKVVLIPQGDPGFDWLFGHKILGLITKYGGANSHMAIRSAELNLPAAIGIGEDKYQEISNYSRIELDCNNKIIRKAD